MIPKPPLLTIAIPTFNRAQYLERLLSSLKEQILPEWPIELLVSDNASPDATHEVVNRFQSAGLQIRYLRNESNLGPDLNILQCYERAAGKYVWIIGDDDFIRAGGIAKVLWHIRNDVYDLIYVSSIGFTDSSLPASDVKNLGFEVCDRTETLARHVNIFFTFLSGNIVNKSRIARVAHIPFTELVGTYLIQLGWVYAALDHHQRSLIIHDPLVAALTDNTGGYRLFQVFGPNLRRITDERIRSATVRRIIVNGALMRFFPTYLLSQRAETGRFVREHPHEILAPAFRDNFLYWFFDYPITCMPRFLARCWIVLLRVINRLDQMMGYPLLGM